MSAGNVEQFGTPFEVYNRPATRFVASFVGTLNTLNARVLDVRQRAVSVDGQTIRLPALPPGAAADAPIALTMRPEAVSLGKPNGQDVVFSGRVSEVSFLGSVIRLKVDLGSNSLSLDTFNDTHTPPPAIDEPVQVSLNSSDILILPN
jgi:putative spermidine/putrescine transport system ATP-binding protein